MSALQKFLLYACLAALLIVSLGGVFPRGVVAATRYFDVNSTTTGSGVTANGSYSWEGNFWNANILAGTGRLKLHGTGSLFLLGSNTFTGGLLFNGSSGVNFNNNNSFGTGAMTWGVSSQILAARTATVPITIGNAVVTRSASTLIMS